MLSEEARQFFRDAAAKRQRAELVCPECSARFVGLAWQRHCSKRCRDRASQRAKRQRYKAPPAPAPDLDSPLAITPTDALAAYLGRPQA